MKFLVVVALAVAASALKTVHVAEEALVLPEVYTTAHAQALIDEVNAKQTSWTAGHNSRFVNATRSFILRHMGALKEPKGMLPEQDIEVGALPSDFDSRTQWGSMCPSTSEIRDQAACGSCWAFGAVEAMTDRICIASKGADTPHISAEDLMTCCNTCGMGCDGGYPSAAWGHFKLAGIVTGGQYGSGQGCQPYKLPKCDHHVTGKYQPCGSEGPTPACDKSCIAGYSKSYTQDKHYGSSAYSVPQDADKIATEIMTNGPVEGAFEVYSDFINYKSGVYKHTSGQLLGGHAIKILGWGVENGDDYWLVANSWNEDWGAQGYFKIAKGNNECGIESGVVAGLPKLN